MSGNLFSQDDILAIRSRKSTDAEKEAEKRAYAQNRREEILDQMDFTAHTFAKYAQEFPSVAQQVGYETRRYLYGADYPDDLRHMSQPMYQIFGHEATNSDLDTKNETDSDIFVTPSRQIVCRRWNSSPRNKLITMGVDEFVATQESMISSKEQGNDIYSFGEGRSAEWEMKWANWAYNLELVASRYAANKYRITGLRSRDEVEKDIKQYFVDILARGPIGFTEDEYIKWKKIDIRRGRYIVTSVYGSYNCPEVWTLRRFRDNVLAKRWYGRLFIQLYYALSLVTVRLFGDMAWFKSFWRSALDNLVSTLRTKGFSSAPYQDSDW